MPAAMQTIWLWLIRIWRCISGEIHTGLHIHTIFWRITSHSYIILQIFYTIEDELHKGCLYPNNCPTNFTHVLFISLSFVWSPFLYDFQFTEYTWKHFFRFYHLFLYIHRTTKKIEIIKHLHFPWIAINVKWSYFSFALFIRAVPFLLIKSNNVNRLHVNIPKLNPVFRWILQIHI